MSLPRRPCFAAALLAVAALACGDDGTDPADVEAPRIRSVRASLDGRTSFDLDREDAERLTASPTPIELTVDVRDPDTALADLVLRVDDEVAAAALPFETELRAGLWRLRGELVPGQTLRVVVVDGGGQVARAPHVLRVPTVAEALAGPWNTPFFTTDQAIRHRWLADWTREGTWTESREEVGTSLVGDFAVTEDHRLAITVRDGGPDGDGDPATPDVRTTARAFVDEVVFGHRPFARVEGDPAGGLVGRWQRGWVVARPDDNGVLVDAVSIEETLRFDADGRYRAARVTEDLVVPGAPVTAVVEGAYRLEPPDSYMGSVGAFLERTPDEGDPSFVLYVVRGDDLLLSPSFRGEGS